MTKNKSKPILLFTIFFLWAGSLYAQQSTNSSGGNASGSGGTLSYSVGQIVFSSHSGTSGTIDRGVQHAYEIYTLDIKKIELNISISVFPNPTTENLTLHISQYNNEKLSYQLFDLQGKLIMTGIIIEEQTQINTSSLAAATYFINIVNQENKNVQSFKIIKH